MNASIQDPTVVLVHGAWVDGSGWKPVYEILVKDGYAVTLVQEPLTSFADDVAADDLERDLGVDEVVVEDLLKGNQRVIGLLLEDAVAVAGDDAVSPVAEQAGHESQQESQEAPEAAELFEDKDDCVRASQ